MITQLYIRNFAIIEELQISFQSGLTILTGETGAGKSILIGALSLILGDRADSQVILNANEKCVLEGSFDVTNVPKAKEYLIEHELLDGDELIIRREMTSQGKSRVFINDTPSTLSVLQPLAHFLIDLHRQFDTIDLQQEQHQLQLIDEIAENQLLLSTYQQQFADYKNSHQAYHKLIAKNAISKQELDYNQFLFQELDQFQAKPNEIEEAEVEIEILNQSEALKSSLQKVAHILSESEEPVISMLKSCIQQLTTFSTKIPKAGPLVERLQSSLIELKDIADEVDQFYNHVQFDEEKINFLTERINEGNRLLKKHHISSTEELLNLYSNLEQKIIAVNDADESELTLKQKTEALFEQVKATANQLTSHRQKIIPNIESKIGNLLEQVGMPNARLKISQTTISISNYGQDKIEFLFDANNSGKYQPIGKVASGGELSRLMLCIKSLLANSTALPTLVFDEIDTGISGETAIQVGQIMKNLAKHHQLICITHLPQIASKANQHLYIYKEENSQGQMNTKLKALSQEERINILAEMLTGKVLNKNSKEMVKNLMEL